GGDPPARGNPGPTRGTGGDPCRPGQRLRGRVHRCPSGAACTADRGTPRAAGGGRSQGPAGRCAGRGGAAAMTWLGANLPLVAELTALHLWLSLPPIVIGFVLAGHLGLLARRYRWLRGGLLTVIGLLHCNPSLAFFVLLPPVISICFLCWRNMSIALTNYAVALMARFGADAFVAVDPLVRQPA